MLQEENHYKVLQIADESHRNPWHTISETQTLKDVIGLIVQQNEIHRVAVLDAKSELKYVLTQSDVISFLAHHLDDLPTLKSKTISELDLGFKEVITVSSKEKVWKSFIQMDAKGVSGLGVVDDQGHLIGHISCADLKGLDIDTQIMDRLRQSVADFKPQLNLVSVLPTATFGEVVTTLEKTKMHRVYILGQDSRQPLGVISQIDIISAVYNSLK